MNSTVGASVMASLKKGITMEYIAWHCRKCGYQKTANIYTSTYPVKCPECGSNNTMRGFPKLPVNSIRRDEEPRRYDWGSDKKEIQFYLRAATGESMGATVTVELATSVTENENPVDEIKELLDIIDEHYLLYSSKGKIKTVLDAMITCQEQSDNNQRENRINELCETIVRAQTEYDNLMVDK